jgi:ribonuclease HI
MHTQMMSLPFQAGFAPDRWTRVTDIMLEKEANNPRCHRLRILALFEKVLSHDHLRLTKTGGAFLENDAIGCYDRLVNNLVLMLLVKLGLPKSVASCIGELCDNVIHLIKTVYGISSVTYGSTTDKPLYGPGQGSTCGTLFWLLCYWVIVTSLDTTISAATFVSACKEILVEITGVSFVDDSSLSATSKYIPDPNLSLEQNRREEVIHLVERLAALGHYWECLLFTTGGAINFQKSHWYLMSWLWKNGIPRLATISQTPASLSLTTGTTALPDMVPRLEPTQGFRTLGVYLTPSGNYSRQVKVLRTYAETFRDQITSSGLTSNEAYCCYMLYIRPKITYPFPCVSLMETHCRHIQAPILEAILPKMQLNRHTPRAVLFAGPRYGGFQLAEYYTDFGYGHLQYLVGHLKLGDDVGQMLLSLITHTQLQVGSTTLFFQLVYPTYAKWIDSTWITDIWKFTHRAHITVDIKSQWMPTLVRQGDIGIMDLALTFQLDTHQLRSINTCRLYLQVVTVSDIVTAKGDHVLLSIMEGECDPQTATQLEWPDVPKPPSSLWTQWHLFLQHFCRGRRLITSLGRWICPPQRRWKWFQDRNQVVWEKVTDSQKWHIYHALPSQRRRTRHSSLIYRDGVPSLTTPLESLLCPVTIESVPGGCFKVSSSGSPFVLPEPLSVPNLWRHAHTPEAFQNTPAFFQHLLNNPPTEQECQAIAEELQDKTLEVCSDGACDETQALSSHGVVFASGLSHEKVASVAGPVDGHPKMVTSYRAELSGIVAALYIIYRVCQHHQVNAGAMTLYWDNKGALMNAFQPIPAGITPYFHTDHDLVELAQSLLQILPIIVTTAWVKGHHKGKDKEFKHVLNDTADRLAGSFQAKQTPHHTIRKPLPPPGYRVHLLYDSSTITTKI